MKKVVTIGGAMVDLYIQQKALACSHLHSDGTDYLLLAVGKKLEISALEKQSGGGATNAAVSFARLGCSATAICSMGDDCEAAFIRNELARNSVNTDALITHKNAMTGLSIIIPCTNGDRTVLAYRGANMLLHENHIPHSLCTTCDALYITSLSGDTARILLPITRQVKKQNKIVAHNPGTSQLVQDVQHTLEALPFIDILILNSFEAQACMRTLGTHLTHKPAEPSPDTTATLPALLRTHSSYHTADFDLRTFFKNIMSRGPAIVVVTNGAEGVYVAHKETIYFHPSLVHNVISTVGAGDAFGSCFVASLLQEKSAPEALIRGIINASSVIQHVGTKTGLLTTQVLDEQLQTTGLHLLQCYSL